MSEQRWTAVDQYIDASIVHQDAALRDTLAAATAAGLPAISVAAPQGKMLHVLALAIGAERVLEIGTLAGYSTIWLARAARSVVTLELDPKHAEVARANFERAGVAGKVEIRVGLAIDSLAELSASGSGPFDLIFIDADKVNIPDYFTWALKLSRVGSLIIVDNVVREGALIDATSTDPSVIGVRRLHDMIASESRVAATTIQTVGSKKYDGFTLAVVVA